MLTTFNSISPSKSSPVMSLPTEVLGNIFLYCKSMALITPVKSRCNVGYDWKWTQVSHVCQRWRQIALRNPSLWATIPPISPKWLEVMVKRSQSIPLSLQFDSPTVNLKAFRPSLISILKSHTSHLGTLSLRGKGSTVENILSAMTAGPAPVLNALCISVERVLPSIWSNLPPEPIPEAFLPTDFLSKGALNLRTVRLHDCSIPPSLNLPLDGITHFDLSYENRELPLHPKDILTTIQAMESLTHLRFQWLPSDERKLKEGLRGHRRQRTATLPTLKQLTLVDCWSFLNALRIPYSAVLNLEAEEGGEVLIHSIGTISSCWIPPPAPKAHRPLAIYEIKGDRERNSSVSLRGWRFGDDNIRQRTPALNVHIGHLRGCMMNKEPLARTMITAFELDHVHTIHLDCFPALLHAHLGHQSRIPLLPALINLSIGTHFDEVSLRACLQDNLFQKTRDVWRENDGICVRIPQLKNLTFNRIDFRRADQLEKMAELRLVDWHDLLERRMMFNEGINVNCITFVGCTGLTKEAMARFRKTVWSVHFLDESEDRAIGIYVPL